MRSHEIDELISQMHDAGAELCRIWKSHNMWYVGGQKNNAPLVVGTAETLSEAGKRWMRSFRKQQTGNNNYWRY